MNSNKRNMQSNIFRLSLNTVNLFKAVISIILVLSMMATYSCSNTSAAVPAPPPPSVPVATIMAADDTTYQEYPASVEGALNIEIRPQVNGSLTKVFFDEGAFVKAGEPLFKINDLPYRAQLNNALASLHAAEAAEGNAQLEIEKLTQLVQNKVVSDYQLKTAKETAAIAMANIEQAKANVSTAQINLDYTLIKAPASGYISRLMKKQGSLVAPGDADALTYLSDVQQVHVYFSLSEKDFVDFKEQYAGETLNDKLKHLPPVDLILANNSMYDRKGRIDMIDGQFDKNTGAITIRANFPNPQGLLRSGNTGKIRLSLAHKNVLIIPQSATVELQDKIFVFAVSDSNKVKKQPVNVIGKSGTNFLVKDGIKSGDRIVISGWDHIQDGQFIQPEKLANNLTAN